MDGITDSMEMSLSKLQELVQSMLQSMGLQSDGTELTNANGCLIGKVPDSGKDWRQKEKKASEDEMAGWYH